MIDFLGLGASQQVVLPDGGTGTRRRTYLDSAATCLMPRSVWDAVGQYLATSCANPHTETSTPSRDTTAAIAQVHRLAGEWVGYNPATDAVILLGSGATEPLNLLASALFGGDRDIAVVSMDSHHSNLLPWMRAAKQIRYIETRDDGSLDLDSLRHLLATEGARVRVVVVSALSNVSGVAAPLRVVAAMAHAVGAQVVVDAAQAAAHLPVQMTQDGLDYVIYSGHKLYAPGSPGVLVGKKTCFDGCGWSFGQVGGGTVERVQLDEVEFKTDVSDRQEAGTPNVPGAIALGAAIKLLSGVGMPYIVEHERALMTRALSGLQTVPELVIYGPTDPRRRYAVVSFNLANLPHPVVAGALNDHFAISVRNGCFCAQPFVRQQLDSTCRTQGYCAPSRIENKGMVRASFGLYTTPLDVDLLVSSLHWIYDNREMLVAHYDDHGMHRNFHPRPGFIL